MRCIGKTVQDSTAIGCAIDMPKNTERRKSGAIHYCRKCDYSSKRRFNVTRHENRFHRVLRGKSIVCCDETFRTKGAYYVHCDKVHPGLKKSNLKFLNKCFPIEGTISVPRSSDRIIRNSAQKLYDRVRSFVQEKYFVALDNEDLENIPLICFLRPSEIACHVKKVFPTYAQEISCSSETELKAELKFELENKLQTEPTSEDTQKDETRSSAMTHTKETTDVNNFENLSSLYFVEPNEVVTPYTEDVSTTVTDENSLCLETESTLKATLDNPQRDLQLSFPPAKKYFLERHRSSSSTKLTRTNTLKHNINNNNRQKGIETNESSRKNRIELTSHRALERAPRRTKKLKLWNRENEAPFVNESSGTVKVLIDNNIPLKQFSQSQREFLKQIDFGIFKNSLET